MTTAAVPRLIEQFERGLDAPICLTWELTYACNLACVHCLSSSGKRDPRELSTRQCMDIIDELQRMQVFYVNIGGGEPTVRPDFWELVDYATAHQVGVKFSTNGVRITPAVAARLAASDYVDVQISLDGATAEVNDAVRGTGSFAMAIRALENLAEAGFTDAKISVVVTRHNVSQLDDFKALADRYGATLRITRLRPSGRGADVWDELHPTAEQQRLLYNWLVAHGERVLTGDGGDRVPEDHFERDQECHRQQHRMHDRHGVTSRPDQQSADEHPGLRGQIRGRTRRVALRPVQEYGHQDLRR